MRRDARMLAALFERSMGLDDAWEVSGTWSGEVEGGPDELHVRVARRRGHAIPCPECGVPCGARDARGRTWRHLDIWQFRTYVHCAVPRTDCPEHGAGTVPVPWEVRPNSHFTALLGDRVLAARVRGRAAEAVAEALGEDDRRLWDMLGRAVAQARGSADYSDVRRVGIDETSRAKGHTYISTMLDLDGRRCVAVTDGNDRGSVGRMCGQLEAHGGDRAAITEVTRDMSGSFSSGVSEEMPQATQTIDRFHVMQLFSRATDRVRCRERRESDERREAPEREENPAGRQREVRKGPAPDRGHPGCGPGLPDGRGDARRLRTGDRRQGRRGRCPAGSPAGRRAPTSPRQGGIPGYLGSRPADAYLEGANSLTRPVKRAARGFRNVEDLATAIFPGLGGLSFDALACAQS